MSVPTTLHSPLPTARSAELTAGNCRQAHAWPWLLFSAVMVLLLAPSFVANIRPARGLIPDFFKEWVSARNYFTGHPVYANQRDSLWRTMRLKPGEGWFEEYNAHPPTAVLISLPFGLLNYQDAHAAWNLCSLALLALTLWRVSVALSLRWNLAGWSAVLGLLLVCDPLRQTINQGQLNLVLLWLLAETWIADRQGRPLLAGWWLGWAAAIKLFPVFLFLYFLMRRDWRAIAAGVVSCAAVMGLTTAILGWQAHVDYVTLAMPALRSMRDAWGNVSLDAFWARLFDAPSSVVEAWQTLPAWRIAGTVLSSLALLGWLIARLRNSDRFKTDDAGFSLCVVAMLLLSPITWAHYFMLLLVPLAIAWRTTFGQGNNSSGGADSSARWSGRQVVFHLVFWSLLLAPRIGWSLAFRLPPTVTTADHRQTTKRSMWKLDGRVALPVHSLTGLSYQTYALLALFGLLYVKPREAVARPS